MNIKALIPIGVVTAFSTVMLLTVQTPLYGQGTVIRRGGADGTSVSNMIFSVFNPSQFSTNGGLVSITNDVVLTNTTSYGTLQVISTSGSAGFNVRSPADANAGLFMYDTGNDGSAIIFKAVGGSNVFYISDFLGTSTNIAIKHSVGVALGLLEVDHLPRSSVEIYGSYGTKNLTKAAAYTLTSTDYVLLVDTAAACTITLPTCVGISGRTYIIKDKSGTATANNITITNSTGAQTIDGILNKLINSAYGNVTVMTDGTNWFTF